MPINPLIALSTQSADLSGAGKTIANSMLQKQRMDREDEQRSRDEELRDLQLQQIKAQMQDAETNRKVKNNIIDAFQAKQYIDAGDTDGLINYLEQNRTSYQNAGLPTDQTDAAIQLARSGDLDAINNDINAKLQVGYGLGILEQPEGQEGFTLAPGSKRFDAQGNEIASVAPKSDVLSPEAEAQKVRIQQAGVESIAQQLEMERLKLEQELEIKGNTPEAQAKLREQELKVEEKEKELAQAELDKESADRLMDDALSITKELLAPELRDSIKAASGPISNMLPTLRASTADTRIKINRLKAILTKDNLKLLSGVLSDSDLRLLGDIAAGGLNLEGSEGAIIDELNRIHEKLSGEPYNAEPDVTENVEPAFTEVEVNGQMARIRRIR